MIESPVRGLSSKVIWFLLIVQPLHPWDRELVSEIRTVRLVDFLPEVGDYFADNQEQT